MISLESITQWLNYTAHTAPGIKQGALAGLIFLVGLIAISLIPKHKKSWRWPAAAALLALITPLAIGGFWWSEGPLGINDWDYYHSLHTGHRSTIVEYHQLPHWNPYICGGTAGLADPEFRFFTPTFLLQLIFGVPTGLRLAVFLATATGAIGMLFLSKRLKLSVYAASIAALGYGFGGVNIIEIVEGHPNIFSAMFIPWIFGAWLAAYRHLTNPNSTRFQRTLWCLITGAFLALTFFQGGIYLLMYTAIAFIGLLALVRRPLQAMLTTVYAGAWALGLAAVKLIPVFFWLSQFQDEHYVSSANILPYLHKVLLARLFHGIPDIIPNQASGWHEYGAYIGPVIAILALWGFIKNRRSRVVQALLVSAIAAILLSASGPFLKPLFDQVSFIPRSNISRFMLFAILPISLLAGYGIDALIRQKKLLPLALFLVGLTAIDLMSFSYPLSQQAFVIPRSVYPIEQAPYPLAYNALRYEFEYFPHQQARRLGHSVVHTRAYEATLKGYGSLDYCSVLSPPRAVRTIHDEGPPTMLDFGKTTGTFTIEDWTPNQVVFSIDTTDDGEAVLNANFAKGWHYQIDDNTPQPAQERGNRVGAVIPAGDHQLTFFYKTKGFALGTTISLLTLAAATVLLITNRRHLRRQASPTEEP